MKKFSQIWTLTLLLKLVLAYFIPMTPDECYYWVWSQKLQLSYFDHPPFIAWLFKLSSILPPLAGLSRLPAVILGHATLWVWYFIWKKISVTSHEKEYERWLLFFMLSPMIGLGSLIATPDVPVVFFWSLAIYFTINILEKQKLIDYIFLGFSLGLGFCSKYHIVIFLPILFLYLIFEKKLHLVRWTYVIATITTGLIFSMPVIIWNYQNDFSSFLFQLNHGLGRTTYKFYWTWTYVLAQIAVIFPTVFYFAIKNKTSEKNRFLTYCAWGPLIFFLLSSFKGLVEINWPIISYPSVLTLALLNNSQAKALRWTKYIWLSMITIVLIQVLSPLKPFGDHQATDKANELIEFSTILPAREKYVPLYASTYQMASWVWHETKNPFYKLHKMSRKDLFDDFEQGMPKSYPIFVAMKDQTALPEWIENNMDKYNISLVEKLDHNFVIIRIEEKIQQ